MAGAVITCEVQWQLREMEPEGQVCAYCGDVGWLAPVGLFPTMTGGLGLMDVAAVPVVTLCQACGEIAAKQMDLEITRQ